MNGGRWVGSAAVVLLAACSSGSDPAEENGVATPPAQVPSVAATPEAPTEIEPPTGLVGPAARGYAMMADLPGAPGVLMMGGADIGGPPNLPDMWTFVLASGWREITPSPLPELPDYGSGVIGNAFEFDLGSDAGIFADIEGNAWAYDPATKTWLVGEATGGPTALLGAFMVYDSGSDRMVVFGGLDLATGGENDETWAYDLDSDSWQRMEPNESPSARNYYQMAYDPRSDRAILFGGFGRTDALGDTWAYDYEADSWTQLSTNRSPPPRGYGWLVYEPVGERMILFGGTDFAEEPLADTWVFDPRTDRWTELDAPGPAARGWHAMAYDVETKMIVLFGGGPTREEYTAETWIFDPRANTWAEVP